MYFDEEEYVLWLEKEQNEIHDRFLSKKLNRKYPRAEKVRDFRLSRSPAYPRFYDREDTDIKAAWRKKTRMFLKQNIHNEAYYRMRLRDFKTYGWISW